MDRDKNAKLIAAADSAFSTLALRIGLDPKAYEATDRWVKKDKTRLHIVQKYESGTNDPVVLRLINRPKDTAQFDAAVQAHQTAANVLANNPTATVPEILISDTQQQTYLMKFFEGLPLVDLCLDHKSHADFLTKAGAWLGAYHQATFEQRRPFQPKFMVNHIAKLRAQAANGIRAVLERDLFVSYCDRIPKLASAAQDHVGMISAKHGDFNAKNILISDTETAAIDFGAQSNAPVGFDIARLLYSYMRMAGDLSSIPTGHTVPPKILSSFTKGYGSIEPDDPIVKLLLRIQILTDWNSLENKDDLATILRFERTKEIARHAFGGG